MASTTGIEIGPDSCVVVGVRRGAGGVVDVSAFRIVDPALWPASDVAQGETLRAVRRSERFPRPARVVVWGLPEEQPADEAMSRAGLRAVTAAGFRVEAVMTPPQALALLAAARRRNSGSGGGAVAWLALNMHGAAIAIVRGKELLFSRTLGWSYNPGEMSSKAQLLQRYSLVAHLAPELRRGIAAVRASHGVAVDAAVTCGDLPELRSLTMPLIEELDLEVETLDSTEGLRPVGKAKHDRFAESATVLRLASAAALAPSRRRRSALLSLPMAAVVIIAALTWGAYAYLRRPAARPVAPQQASGPTPPAFRASRPEAPPGQKPSSPVPSPAAASPPTTKTPAVVPPARPAAQPSSVAPDPRAAEKPMTPGARETVLVPPKPVAPAAPAVPRAVPSTATKPVPEPVSPAVTGARPPVRQEGPATLRLEPPPAPPPSTAARPPGRQDEPAVLKRTPPAAVPSSAPVPPSANLPREAIPSQSPPVRQPAPQIAKAPRPRETATAAAPLAAPGVPGSRQVPLKDGPGTRLVPLTDPLPRVDSILVDQDRRLAIVDGAIVTVGDAVGPRIVAQIERNAVMLREPSGLVVRVPVRGRPKSL